MSFLLRSSVQRVAPMVCAQPIRAFTTRSANFDFGWQKLVTPLTAPQFITRMKEIDNKFAAMKAEMFGVNEVVEPIDWAAWEKQIENKALFQQLKKEYESIVYPDIKGEDLTQINSTLDNNIAGATRAAAFSASELPKLEEQLKNAVVEKNEIHNWSLEDYYRRYPGLEEQMREEYMNGEFLKSDAEDRLMAMDINELRKLARNPANDIAAQLPEGLKDRVGDFSLEQELKNTQQQLDQMFKGSKLYEQFKTDLAAEKKKAAADKVEHH